MKLLQRLKVRHPNHGSYMRSTRSPSYLSKNLQTVLQLLQVCHFGRCIRTYQLDLGIDQSKQVGLEPKIDCKDSSVYQHLDFCFHRAFPMQMAEYDQYQHLLVQRHQGSDLQEVRTALLTSIPSIELRLQRFISHLRQHQTQ